ncbi:MAG: RsmD family RNA methyltransferase [Candidatus Dormibacteraceae bacterium]
MRVHGGEAGGRRLLAPPDIRPSEGRVKLAIFNMLGDLRWVARALDLCAGSGAFGIEALSRGAGEATFVDRSPRSIDSIRRNLAALGYGTRSQVRRDEVVRFCEQQAAFVRTCDLLFCDPPYNDPVLPRLLQLLDRATAAEALVVVEHGARVDLPALARLRPERQRRYGDTQVTILQAAEEA